MTTPLRLELPVGQLGRLTGQTETLPPIVRDDDGSGGPLDRDQEAALIGEPVPVVFARWRSALPEGQAGGVTISPKAVDGRFSNDAAGAVTARYQLLLSDGQIGSIQVRDVFQGGARVGQLTQAYDRRAGDWGPGRQMVSWADNPPPDAPSFVGTGQGTCSDLTMGSFSITRAAGVTTWRRQVHVFIREGLSVYRFIEDDEGPSDNLADLAVWAMLKTGRVSAQLIDAASMASAAEFLEANTLAFNARISDATGILDWFTEVLPHYLLRLVRSRGVYRLRPLMPTTAGGVIDQGQISSSRTFTTEDIEPSSVSLSAIPAGDRRPVAVLVKWRQQLESADSFVRTTTVRYGGSAVAGPYEQVDLSQYATNVVHAVTYGAFRLARRRYIEHRLTFRLRPQSDSEQIAEGDVVRVVLSARTPTGTVRVDQFYTVEQISRSRGGIASLELLHFPVDDQGRSLINLDTANAAAGAVDLPIYISSGFEFDFSFDENSYLDFNVPFDLGPWAGWDPPSLDLNLYADLDWPGGVEIPQQQPPGTEPIGAISTLNPVPVPSGAIPPIGDGWGPGRINAPDIEVLNLSGEQSFAGYQGDITIDAVLLDYPDVFYLIDQPEAVGLSARVSVDNPPTDGALRLILSDGLEDGIEVSIAEGETSVMLPDGLSSRTDTLFDPAVRSLAVLGWRGGGYAQAEPTELEPDPPPAITATPVPFTVQTYTATVTAVAARPWVWEGDAWSFADVTFDPNFIWSYAGQEWSRRGIFIGAGIPLGDDLPWVWDVAQQLWTYPDPKPAGWTWLDADQRWQRTSPATDPATRPAGPPSSPPPIPTSEPPLASYYTIVTEVTVDKVPINSLAESLSTALRDYRELDDGSIEDVQSVGPAIINGVPMFFDDWRWNPAEGHWSRSSPDTAWYWDPYGVTWVYLDDPGDWTWNQSAEDWQGGTNPSPGLPPLQHNSTHPPDGERWTLTTDGTLWVGTAHVEGGVEPFFGNLLQGFATHHLPFPTILAPETLPT